MCFVLGPGVGAVPCNDDAADTQRALRAALLGLTGNPVQELVSVNLGAKLADLGLASFFPDEVGSFPACWFCLVCMLAAPLRQAWPAINSVRELATKLKTRAKQGDKDVFLVVDLKK